MTARTDVLLWTDSTAPYIEAINAAGLAGRVAIDTLPRDPLEQFALALQVHVIAMKGIERLRVQLRQKSQRIERIVGARQGYPARIAQRRDAPKAHIDRLLLEPIADHRLEF